MEGLFTPPNVANLCNNIKPGDLIHEDVRQSFSEYFGRFNRRQKVYIRQDDHSVLQHLPCFVLKVCIDQEYRTPFKINYIYILTVGIV